MGVESTLTSLSDSITGDDNIAYVLLPYQWDEQVVYAASVVGMDDPAATIAYIESVAPATVSQYLEVAIPMLQAKYIEALMAQGMAVSVVGRQRMEDTLRSIFACGTLLSPYDGLCHAGLLDHRTKTGSREWALIFSERSPKLDMAVMHAAFDGISPIFDVLEDSL